MDSFQRQIYMSTRTELEESFISDTEESTSEVLELCAFTFGSQTDASTNTVVINSDDSDNECFSLNDDASLFSETQNLSSENESDEISSTDIETSSGTADLDTFADNRCTDEGTDLFEVSSFGDDSLPNEPMTDTLNNESTFSAKNQLVSPFGFMSSTGVFNVNNITSAHKYDICSEKMDLSYIKGRDGNKHYFYDIKKQNEITYKYNDNEIINNTLELLHQYHMSKWRYSGEVGNNIELKTITSTVQWRKIKDELNMKNVLFGIMVLLILLGITYHMIFILYWHLVNLIGRFPLLLLIALVAYRLIYKHFSSSQKACTILAGIEHEHLQGGNV